MSGEAVLNILKSTRFAEKFEILAEQS